MKILVTGGNGLTGRYIVQRLAKEHDVEVLDHRAGDDPRVISHQSDVLDLEALRTLTRGRDGVVHLAAIPHPLENPPEEVFRVNVLGTFNVLEASAENGVASVVFMSSESVLGFAFSGGSVGPEYLPVDEHHPLRPVDPYGLSKSVGEMLCASYSRREAMATICLRPPWVWVPEEGEIHRYRELLEHPESWPQTLWAYIHVFDLAEAVAMALGRRFPRGYHATCFVSSAENWTGRDSRELAQTYYPKARVEEPLRRGPYSLLSTLSAESVLGFKPRYTYRDLPGLVVG